MVRLNLDASRLSGGGAVARAVVASVLCASLAGPPQQALASIDVTAPEVVGSPVAREVVGLVDKYFLDRKFNGVNLPESYRKIVKREPLTEEQALDESIGLTKSLGDRYTRVLTPSQAEKLGKYDVTGVGINLVIAENGDVKVGAVPPADTDASRLGIQFGDVVQSINGQAAAGMTSFDALEAIQTDSLNVVLELKPADGSKAREVTLRKAFVQKSPVSYHVVNTDDGARIGYIKLSEFNAKCKKGISEAVTAMQAEGAERFVLDLRDNSGGVLDGALGISGLFMPRPLVLYVTDANGSMQPLYSRVSKISSEPLQVWVNQATASSGEVLAAALHDNCRATLIGSKTYGKGVIQGVFGLSDGGALIETVASYATPSRTEINLKGVDVDTKRMFVSDVLGSSFVDADVKQLADLKQFRQAERSCLATSDLL